MRNHEYANSYSRIMLSRVSLSLAILLSLYCSAVNAEIYKYTDENGNIVYSDTPPIEQPSLEPAELPSVIYQPATRPASANEPQELSELELPPLSIRLQSPENGRTLTPGERNLAISVITNRALQEDESLQLMINGQVWGSAGKASSWTISEITRGQHNIQVVGLDAHNSQIAISGIHSVFVIRPRILSP